MEAASDPPELHAVVISRAGMGDRARRIAAAVEGHVRDLTVIDSNPEDADETGAGFSPRVCDRLRELDYTRNNLGWGIDWAAIAHAHASGLLVCRDTSLLVHHDVSRSYGSGAALDEMIGFFAQLTQAERIQIVLLRAHFLQARRERHRGVLHRLYRRIRPHRVQRDWQLA